MRKLMFLSLLVLWLNTSCSPPPNVDQEPDTGQNLPLEFGLNDALSDAAKIGFSEVAARTSEDGIEIATIFANPNSDSFAVALLVDGNGVVARPRGTANNLQGWDLYYGGTAPLGFLTADGLVVADVIEDPDDNAGGDAAYSITILEGLDGYSTPSLNDAGQVIDNDGIAWNNGSPNAIHTDPTVNVSDVNELGDVVGSYSTGTGTTHAFRLSRGVFTDLGTLGGPELISVGVDINDSGLVAGTATATIGGSYIPVLWRNGVISSLGSLGGVSGYVTSLNATGSIVGFSSTANGFNHAFLWREGEMTDLGTLGGNESVANEILNNGEVLGRAQDGSGHWRVCRWRDQTIENLEDPFTNALRAGGNTVGQVLATGTDSAGAIITAILSGGTWQLLDDLLPIDSGWSIFGSTEINENGQIVAGGTRGGETRLLLLTPQSSPLNSENLSIRNAGRTTSVPKGTAVFQQSLPGSFQSCVTALGQPARELSAALDTCAGSNAHRTSHDEFGLEFNRCLHNLAFSTSSVPPVGGQWYQSIQQLTQGLIGCCPPTITFEGDPTCIQVGESREYQVIFQPSRQCQWFPLGSSHFASSAESVVRKSTDPAKFDPIPLASNDDVQRFGHTMNVTAGSPGMATITHTASVLYGGTANAFPSSFSVRVQQCDSPRTLDTTSCTCSCPPQVAQQCTFPNVYDAASCTCSCPSGTQSCVAPFVLDATSCTCTCPTAAAQQCAAPHVFDAASCTCSCSPGANCDPDSNDNSNDNGNSNDNSNDNDNGGQGVFEPCGDSPAPWEGRWVSDGTFSWDPNSSALPHDDCQNYVTELVLSKDEFCTTRETICRDGHRYEENSGCTPAAPERGPYIYCYPDGNGGYEYCQQICRNVYAAGPPNVCDFSPKELLEFRVLSQGNFAAIGSSLSISGDLLIDGKCGEDDPTGANLRRQ